MYNLLLIQIIILIIFLFINNNLKLIDKFTNNNKICIILTTYINSNEKENMYLERVKKWLKTGIDIYLVDSNNKGLPIVDNHYYEYLFDQSKEDYYKSKNNSSILEINSLIKIINYYQLTKKYDYIYKITGKYFIKEYKKLYILPKEKYDIINQHRSRKNWNNSEIVGFNSSKIINLLNYILNINDGGFEKGLGSLKKYKNLKIKKLQPLTVVKCSYFAKRNKGDTLYIL